MKKSVVNAFLFLIGADVDVEDGILWSVVIVTPTMKRTHSAMEASEIVFCDTSSSCDSSLTAVTVMLMATKAGAVPLAILLHSDLTKESYQSAFQLLKKRHPFCFGGKNVRLNWK